MLFPKASAVLLCAAALSEAISIPDAGYHVAGVAARSPQGFGQGGNFSGGQGFNKAQGNNNANKNNGGGNAKSSTLVAAATSTKAATNGNAGNNNAAASASGGSGSQCLKANAVQTGSASDGNNPPVQDQAASATYVYSDHLLNMTDFLSDSANFINFCSGSTLTNGLQVKGGSCNGVGKLNSSFSISRIATDKPHSNGQDPLHSQYDLRHHRVPQTRREHRR
jgi:hypothetical protein